MRVAIISDIHGNLPALEAVLQAVDGERPDEIWCLGDLVGYGPRPNECCDVVRASVQICLRGNHDLGVLGLLDLDSRQAFFRRLPYDVERTQAEIREQGLPDALAARLGGGV